MDIYRKERGNIILGKSFPMFLREGHQRYLLTWVEVYQDGKIQCWDLGDEFPWQRDEPSSDLSWREFVQVVEQGKLVVALPEQSLLSIPLLNAFMVSPASPTNQELSQEDVVLLVQDILHDLNGEPNSSRQCLDAFFTFLDDPSPQTHEQLRKSYERVPSISRMSILHDIENGDTTITAIPARDVQAINRDWLEEQRQAYDYLR